jgi:hypothetical protein
MVIDKKGLEPAQLAKSGGWWVEAIYGIDIQETRELGLQIQFWCAEAINFLGEVAQEYNQMKIQELAEINRVVL